METDSKDLSMTQKPLVFVGSSSEGLEVAETFQVALESSNFCEVEVWNQGMFLPGNHTMGDLVAKARTVDFAVLLMTADDNISSRGTNGLSPRDNVLLELGLFMGIVGTDRVFMLTPRVEGLKIPSDLYGVTRLTYEPARQDGNIRAALTSAVHDARKVIAARGRRTRSNVHGAFERSAVAINGATTHEAVTSLARELTSIRHSAAAQGWRVLGGSDATTLRLVTPARKRLSFPIAEDASQARLDLRRFVGELRANGLRVNHRVRGRIHVEPRS